jgi:hypothetical protein
LTSGHPLAPTIPEALFCTYELGTYICRYIYVYLYVNINRYAFISVYSCIYILICTYIYIYIYLYICVYIVYTVYIYSSDHPTYELGFAVITAALAVGSSGNVYIYIYTYV